MGNTLKQLIKERMLAPEWDALHEKMGISKTRLTQIFNRPQRMTFEEINKLCEIMNTPAIDVHLLVHQYKCGYDVLTLAQAELFADNSIS